MCTYICIEWTSSYNFKLIINFEGVSYAAIMSEQLLNITVSYAGGKKAVALAVKPSLVLSDTQVDYAETELRKELVRAFRVIGEATFYLHEAESGRIMSKESFRDPSYCEHFPRYWYLVVAEPERNRIENEEKERPSLKVSCCECVL